MRHQKRLQSQGDEAPMTIGRTLVTADWVLPVVSEPVAEGAVLVSGDRVEAVGPAAELRGAAPDATEERFVGGVILPGLVNAHTHLSLTALEGAVPPMEFDAWIGEIVPRIEAMTPDEQDASARSGVRRMLAAGITAVGDITYRDESMAPASQEGLAGFFFREILGKTGDEVSAFLTDTGFPPQGTGRVYPALSPHSPYSTGPAAMLETVRIARELGVPCMMHVAESPAEEALVRRGEGPFVRLAAKTAPGFEVPGTSSVAYLEGLGVLDDLICVHVVHVDEADAARIAEKARGVVLCPRSNRYLECGDPPVRTLVDAGVQMALGTDSIASNRDFDLFEEARSILEIYPAIGHDRLLRMMTAEGARVLGLHGHGTLAPGSPADLVALALGATEEPVRDVVGTARRRDVAAVMSAGEWRFHGRRA